MNQKWRKKYNFNRKYYHPKIYSKTRPSKPKRKLVVPKFFWLAVMALFLVGTLAWFVFGSGYFLVKEIRVIGSVTPEVETSINSLHGEHLLTYTTSGMEKNLKKTQGSIKKIKISKGLPDTLLVSVDLRQPVLVWRSQGKDFLIDKTGVVYTADVSELKSIKDLPLVEDTMNQPVTPGSAFVTPQFVGFINDLNQKFSETFPIKVEKFTVRETTFEIELHTSEGWYAILDTNRLIDPQLLGLESVFEKFGSDIKEYIDLRIEGKAYFK